jgi:hypothetical protein
MTRFDWREYRMMVLTLTREREPNIHSPEEDSISAGEDFQGALPR